MSGPHPRPDRFELGTDGPGVIVVGVDGSESSWHALHYAVGVARRHGSSILAVHALHMPALAYGPYADPLPVCDLDSEDNELGEAVGRIGEQYSVDVTFVRTEGEPGSTIAAVAKADHADLIVVGASQKAGHRYFGSTGQRLIRNGKYPVVVVP